jgi:hypothetical protein
MYHSSYVAGKLGTWRERGKKKLSGLLAKMGYVHTLLGYALSRNPDDDDLEDFPSNKRNNHISTWTWI